VTAVKSWTFHQRGSRTKATLRIDIESTEWRIIVTIMDPQGRVVDVYTFTLDNLWVKIIKATMM
jgi:hypothetical protein